MTITHSGFVALIGRPNVGKSTLLNRLIGEKISIISPKPQTTRWQILGIKTLDSTQIIYIDTPGMHQGETDAMNRYMNRVAHSVLHDADVILFLVDANEWDKDDELAVKKLQDVEKPIILVVNKVDMVKDKLKLLPFIDKIKEKANFAEVIPLSAKKGENVEALEQTIMTLLPEGPALYPTDQLTDKNIRFQIAEIIREKLINATEQELPYATTVEIEQMAERHEPDKKALTEISAIIWVERPGQKVIVIGKGGEKLKRIGTSARIDIEKLLSTKVFLRLWVKVKEHWTDDDKALKGLGYD
ncbi:MAG: GTPase Era [Gammaproteobacteria bacterium]|nr:GTPase Era [Gammaproteobacteria bacterium]